MKPYDDCTFCGGEVKEKRERLDYRFHGQLFIIENVPLGVCKQCGEKFLMAQIAKKLEKLATSPQKHLKAVAIPVISLA
jgi:YgiT-type zinc finger domain-containing protein